MTYILHIDTSGKTGLVMISADGRIFVSRQNNTEKDHAATINLMIDAVLADAGIGLSDLQAIAVCTGPGSYTGLRIGMATAKGICYAMDIPMICHNKLELLVDEQANDSLHISILPAREGEYFVQHFGSSGNFSEPTHVLSNDLNEYLEKFSQNIITIYGYLMDDIIRIKNAIIKPTYEVNQHLWSILALANFMNKEFVNIAHVEPMYIKSVFISKKG